MSHPIVNQYDSKMSVRAATVADITLSGLQTVDDVALNPNDRVLVKNQTNAAQNGLYQVKTGAWNRTADADGPNEVTAGMLVTVTEGNQAFTQWVLTTPDPINLGTTPLSFQPISSDVNFVHIQGSPANIWPIMHNLGKYPSVSVLDSADRLVYADIHHTSNNQLEVLFSSPQTGKVMLN